MKHVFNLYISELNGYLKCLARLSCGRSSFGASIYDAAEDIDTFVSNLVEVWGRGDEYVPCRDFKYLKKEPIDYATLMDEVAAFIFHGLIDKDRMPSDKVRNYAHQTIFEDINEYYGLLSTSTNEKGDFHPLISGDIHKLNIKLEHDKKETLYFLTHIESYYVITYFLRDSV